MTHNISNSPIKKAIDPKIIPKNAGSWRKIFDVILLKTFFSFNAQTPIDKMHNPNIWNDQNWPSVQSNPLNAKLVKTHPTNNIDTKNRIFKKT